MSTGWASWAYAERPNAADEALCRSSPLRPDDGPNRDELPKRRVDGRRIGECLRKIYIKDARSPTACVRIPTRLGPVGDLGHLPKRGRRWLIRFRTPYAHGGSPCGR